MTEFTAAEKLAEIEREIAMRVRHYPALIARGTLSFELAARRADIMCAVAKDYREQMLVENRAP